MIDKLFGSGRPGKRAPDQDYGDRLPPGQHTVDHWPLLTYGATPDVKTEQWQFSLTGLVESELTLSFMEFAEVSWQNTTADFHCVTRFSVMDNHWEGVPVQAVLRRARPLPDARAVMVHCYGGYTTNVLLSDLDRADNLFALRRNGEPLQREHGGPVRLIIPHLYAWKSAKWVRGLEFLARDTPGFWEVNGYHIRGDPFEEERFQ